MAIFHLNLSTISRAKGRTATAAAAYRSGENITDERTGLKFQYENRQKNVLAAGLLFPDTASVKGWTRSQLWNEAEKSETRKNSRVAKEITVAIPAELSTQQAEKLTQTFGRWLVTRYGCGVDFALHKPNPKGSDLNVHAHLMMTDRRMTGDGFGEKIRELTDRAQGPKETEIIREAWEKLANQMLLLTEHTERIDRRTLKEQGEQREPSRKIGVAATAMERRGIRTELGELNRRIREANERVKKEALKRLIFARERAQSVWERLRVTERDRRLHKVNTALSEAPQHSPRVEQANTEFPKRTGAGEPPNRSASGRVL
jgi:hypothetical protein